MKVKIQELKGNTLVDAEILDAKSTRLILPSLVDGWRFNFRKHAQIRGVETYVLVLQQTPTVIEGCLIFEMKEHIEPYMAFVEIAPHNLGLEKRYDKVAGCLIAYACRLSFMKGNEVYGGWLAFDVLEEEKENETRLMALYSKKYNALKYGETTMVIPPEGGEKLINNYLI